MLACIGVAIALLAGCRSSTEDSAGAPDENAAAARSAEWAQARDRVMRRAREHMDADNPIQAAIELAPWRDVADAEARGLHNAAEKLAVPVRAELAREAEYAAGRERARRAEQREAELRDRPPVASVWSGTYPQVERLLKRIAHDPTGFELLSCTRAVRMDPGWGTTCQYRMRNGFGALRLQSDRFRIDGDVAELLR